MNDLRVARAVLLRPTMVGILRCGKMLPPQLNLMTENKFADAPGGGDFGIQNVQVLASQVVLHFAPEHPRLGVQSTSCYTSTLAPVVSGHKSLVSWLRWCLNRGSSSRRLLSPAPWHALAGSLAPPSWCRLAVAL